MMYISKNKENRLNFGKLKPKTIHSVIQVRIPKKYKKKKNIGFFLIGKNRISISMKKYLFILINIDGQYYRGRMAKHHLQLQSHSSGMFEPEHCRLSL